MSASDVPRSSLGLERVVAELRGARERTPGVAGKRRELPSREALVGVVKGLRAALFPAHFGPADVGDEGIDYFVGRTLDATLATLRAQVRRSLCFGDSPDTADLDARAATITRDFAARLPEVYARLSEDIDAAFQGDPAAKSVDETLFCYPGVTAITHHRLAHELYDLGAPLLARILSEIAHSETGIDIHPGAVIGERFFIDHGTGVVIGETAVIGKRVRIYQGVTLGAKSFPLDEHGVPKKGLARHPIVEDDVVVYAGATILGRITIGEGSSIGGNVWLTRSVPPKSHITQALSRNEVFQDGLGI